ncbi:MAG: LysM peptidoglycan-binding domain-containing protein [Chlorobi bacterium]|nr:LysM peptidoglycan-binding domain-containing protein [Chlorobiota bacterium]
MLKDKYQSLLDLGVELNVQNGDWKEEGGKLRITGTAAYQYDKDRLWDKIKSYENWENEVEADIAVANGDLYGLYVVKPGDTLSKLSKAHYGDPNRYMEIFKANSDQLSDPDIIRVGQQLKIPSK